MDQLIRNVSELAAIGASLFSLADLRSRCAKQRARAPPPAACAWSRRAFWVAERPRVRPSVPRAGAFLMPPRQAACGFGYRTSSTSQTMPLWRFHFQSVAGAAGLEAYRHRGTARSSTQLTSKTKKRGDPSPAPKRYSSLGGDPDEGCLLERRLSWLGETRYRWRGAWLRSARERSDLAMAFTLVRKERGSSSLPRSRTRRVRRERRCRPVLPGLANRNGQHVRLARDGIRGSSRRPLLRYHRQLRLVVAERSGWRWCR